MQRWTRRLYLWLGVLLFVLYVGSYITLSRQGYAEADQYHMKGFYYFSPDNSDRWRFHNYACVWLFARSTWLIGRLGSDGIRRPSRCGAWADNVEPEAARVCQEST
jgi:hypothetical protein